MVRLDTVVLGGATHSDSLLCSPTRLVVTLTPGEKLIIVLLWYLGEGQISQLDFTSHQSDISAHQNTNSGAPTLSRSSQEI